MEIIFLLVPLAIALLGLIIWGFLWAVRSGQFDDLEGPAHAILLDDDENQKSPLNNESEKPPEKSAPQNSANRDSK